MSELVRALILAGLLSGTQPITIMGLLLVMNGAKPKRNGWAFIAGAFLVETALVLSASLFLGGAVESDSAPGRAFLLIRLGLGLVLLTLGLLARRPPKKPAPEVPNALKRLHELPPSKSFVAGLLLADYQGPVVASLAIAATNVSEAGRLFSVLFYTVLGTGIPISVLLITTNSKKANNKVTSGTNWVMMNRRQLVSWVTLALGILLVGDAALGLVAQLNH